MYAKNVLPIFDKIRECVDCLELIVDDSGQIHFKNNIVAQPKRPVMLYLSVEARHRLLRVQKQACLV